MVSGRADRYYILLKGDLEVIAAKGNLIIPRRNSILMSYQGHLLLLLLSIHIYTGDLPATAVDVMRGPVITKILDKNKKK